VTYPMIGDPELKVPTTNTVHTVALLTAVRAARAASAKLPIRSAQV
jgi:hypothetical protein